MFFPGSRYEKSRVVQVTGEDGQTVPAVDPPRPSAASPALVHRRVEGQRLDHISGHYLGDATAFWRLCDAANAEAPDALTIHHEIAVPQRRT
jgi:hypothetical protein